MGFRFEKTEQYQEWEFGLSAKPRAQIEKRLANIEINEHFGDVRQLDVGLAELKFKNGTRIYFSIKNDGNKTIILLLGGNKNGQSKDIAKAKKLLSK